MTFSDVLMSRPVSVVSPVISSLAGAIRQYVMSVIPSGYVRDYFIDTELPITRNIARRSFRPLTKSQLSVRKLPLLSIKVDTTADMSDYGTGVTFWTSNRYLSDPTRLSRLIADDNGARYVGFETERMVVRFQVSFTVETDLKAMELMMYLRRTLPVTYKVFLNDLDIATEIPRDVLRLIWTDLGLGDGKNSSDMATFQNYLASVTAGNVEQVVNSATKNISYAFSYRTNALVNISSVPTMSVNREGNILKNAQVDIGFEVDVKVPISYAYKQYNTLNSITDSTPFDITSDADSAYFSCSVRSRPPENLDGNLQLVYFTSIVTDNIDPLKGTNEDITDLSFLIEERYKTYIDMILLRSNGSSLVTTKLWLDGTELNSNTFSFDYEVWTLTINKLAYQPRQKYHFGLYVNLADLEKLVPLIRNEQTRSPYY
jgi:hypothetical protein